MSEKIMFRGREVVQVNAGNFLDCAKCVGGGCLELPVCKNGYFEYVKPTINVFIEMPAKDCAYFACSIGKANIASGIYSTRRAAIRGAKRFCAKIGFTCRIKEDK